MENVSWGDIRGRMKDILVLQEKAAESLLEQAQILAKHDEHLDRLGRELESMVRNADDPKRGR